MTCKLTHTQSTRYVLVLPSEGDRGPLSLLEVLVMLPLGVSSSSRLVAREESSTLTTVCNKFQWAGEKLNWNTVCIGAQY